MSEHTEMTFVILEGYDFVADYDGRETLIMHWARSIRSHVAVLVTANGLYLPTDWQSEQPQSLDKAKTYDWLPCYEFIDFGNADYQKVMDHCARFGLLPC